MDKRSLLFLFCVSASFLGLQLFFNGSKKPLVQQERVQKKELAIAAKPVVQRETLLSPSSSDEAFYVLENEYQQLVFSTRGAGLVEINLPLKNKDHPKSIVKEIGIDRQILAASPQNARFPLHPYAVVSSSGEMLQKEKGAEGGYYPLLRRPLLNPNGTEKTSIPPEYYAFNTLSDEPGIENLSFRVTEFTSRTIRFESSYQGRKIAKTYTIPEERNGPYCLVLDVEINGDGQTLWLSSGVPDVEIVGGSYSPQAKLQLTKNGSSEVDELSLPKEGFKEDRSVSPNWISNCNGFLGLITDPLSEIGSGYRIKKVEGTSLPTRLSLIDAAYHLYKPVDYPGYMTLLPLKQGHQQFRIFAGPYDESLLKTLDELYEDPLHNYNPEYRLAISLQGWFSFISQPFAKFLFFLMQIFYAVSRSWAASILLLTIALRLMMYPLNNWSIRSTLKMQEIAPKVKAIQERNKKDPRKGQAEVMGLYKEAGVNPFSGCLPMLLQMPFLIGMFYMLKSSFPLRGASFIPGWIDDLAAPDVVLSWGPPLWIVGNSLHLLPILMGVVMFIQAKMSQKTVKDASQLSDQERQQRAMGTMMSVLFTFMFYSFPSGLNIYFMLSTLLGVVQQKWMMKKINVVKV